MSLLSIGRIQVESSDSSSFLTFLCFVRVNANIMSFFRDFCNHTVDSCSFSLIFRLCHLGLVSPVIFILLDKVSINGMGDSQGDPTTEMESWIDSVLLLWNSMQPSALFTFM